MAVKSRKDAAAASVLIDAGRDADRRGRNCKIDGADHEFVGKRLGSVNPHEAPRAGSIFTAET